MKKKKCDNCKIKHDTEDSNFWTLHMYDHLDEQSRRATTKEYINGLFREYLQYLH